MTVKLLERWPRWLRRTLIVIVGGAALWYVAVYLTGVRATRLVNRLLKEWATGEVARQSDSLYTLTIGELHFNWPFRRVTLDSATITTDTARNNRKAWPVATLSGVLRTCTISGVEVTRLVLGRGLSASQIGCALVRWNADAPVDSVAHALFAAGPSARPAPRPRAPRLSADSARAIAATAAATPPSQSLVTFQRRLTLPDQVPSIRLGRIIFPTLAATLVQRHPSGDHAKFDLARARLHIANIIIDESDSARAERPLFADNVELLADSAQFRPDTARLVSVGHVAISLTDSSILVQDFQAGPIISDAEFQRRSPYRRDRIRVSAARLAIRGVDRTQWSRRGAIQARTVELDSFRFEVRSDKRKPPRPGPKVSHRSLQGFMAGFSRGLSIDTIRVTNATIVYEEFAARRERPGRLTMDQVDVTGLLAHHVPGRRTTENPMTLDVRGRFMSQGALAVHVTVPLDAVDFTMQVRGSVGPFDAMALNALIEEILPARVKSGRIDGVAFQFAVTNGRARGTVTPRYHDLAADITGRGMTGVMGSGPIGGLLRGAAEAVQGMKVRQNNPGSPSERPVVGTVDYLFKGESLPAFFFNAIKDGMLGVALK